MASHRPAKGASADGIETSFMKRVAFRQTLHPHPEPARRSMGFHGFDHVLRAGGMKTAPRRQQRRDPSLIDTQSAENKCPNHRCDCSGWDPHLAITFKSARSTSAKLATVAARRGLTTISQPAARLVRCNRKASRSRRLIRLRTTAPPSARVAVTPSREPGGGSRSPDSAPARARQNAASNGLDTRKPWS